MDDFHWDDWNQISMIVHKGKTIMRMEKRETETKHKYKLHKIKVNLVKVILAWEKYNGPNVRYLYKYSRGVVF